MAEFIEARRKGFDLDDTTVGREGITRFGGFLKGRRGYSLPIHTLDDLPVLDHTPLDIPGVKSAALWWHVRRKAIPGVANRLRQEIDQGVKIYGISGRPATLEWHKATVSQLQREGIPIEEPNLILTPLGVSTAVSKAVAIRDLGIEEFNDDDLKTILYLAYLFPERSFKWIRHGLTNIPVPKGLFVQRPNIQQIPINEWMSI